MTTPAHNPNVAGHILARSTDGITAWVDLTTGNVRPLISGADENEPGNQGNQPVTLTAEQQAHVDRLIGQARQAGRQSGETQTRSEIEAYLSAQADAANGQTATDLDRLRSERDAARQERDAARGEFTSVAGERDQVVLDAFAMVALIGTELPHDAITDALALLGHQPGDDLTALANRAEALKTRRPGLWVTADGQVPPPPPPGGGGGPRPTPPAAKSALQAGAERARQRYPQPSAA